MKTIPVGNFYRRIAAAAVGSLGCALTRLGQDERVQPRALRARLHGDFVKTPGPKYGNVACVRVRHSTGGTAERRGGVGLVPGFCPCPQACRATVSLVETSRG